MSDGFDARRAEEPVSLAAWQDRLSEAGNAERFNAVLQEPDPAKRLEYIRDVYSFLQAQQLLENGRRFQELSDKVSASNGMIAEGFRNLDEIEKRRSSFGFGSGFFAGMLFFGLAATGFLYLKSTR